MTHSEIAFVFLLIAIVYAAAGFGGGSSYLAVLALAGTAPAVMRPTALLCNIVVVIGNLLVFYRSGQLPWRKGLLLVVAGMPFAFLGGYWKLSEHAFFILLGAALVLAAGAMVLQDWLKPIKGDSIRPLAPAGNIALGGSLGLLAGLTGIGGGIFLAPILYLLRWDQPKAISATASLFIFTQSFAGLAGQFSRQGAPGWTWLLPLLLAVALGGQIGVRWSVRVVSQSAIRYLTAALILYAGLNILWKHL